MLHRNSVLLRNRMLKRKCPNHVCIPRLLYQWSLCPGLVFSVIPFILKVDSEIPDQTDQSLCCLHRLYLCCSAFSLNLEVTAKILKLKAPCIKIIDDKSKTIKHRRLSWKSRRQFSLLPPTNEGWLFMC